ncbi:MAG TPA: hypothetical protein VK914_10185 [bacterium]|jgi:hypothetical protein|nr:hypothetical protein [bacterium]
MKTIGLLAIVGLFLQGCVTLVTPHVSSMNFDPNAMYVVGKASGETTAYRFFGLTVAEPDGEFSSQTAITKALEEHGGGDALINTVIDVEESSFPLGWGWFGWETIRVNGTAVYFKSQARFPTTTLDSTPQPSSQPSTSSPTIFDSSPVQTIDHAQP